MLKWALKKLLFLTLFRRCWWAIMETRMLKAPFPVVPIINVQLFQRNIFFASVYFSFWYNLICAVHSLHRKINDFSPSQYGKKDIIPIFITDLLPKLPVSIFLTFFKIQSFTLRLKFDISRRTLFWIIYTVWNKTKSASRKRFWRQNLSNEDISKSITQ